MEARRDPPNDCTFLVSEIRLWRSSPSLRVVACACSALARHCARSLWGRGPARALPTRARRAKPGDTRSIHHGRALHEREAAVPSAPGPCSHVPALPSHCARWLARVARLRATALALSGDEAQHVRFRRARAAPRWRHSVHALWKGTARARSRRSFGARPVLPRASPAPHCARWLARVARLRATALALSGDEAQHVRFRRARAAPRWRHSLHALWKGTARARGRRSFGARPVLPRASPAPHCARWLARVARLRATALALSGDEAQHVRFRRARAPRQALATLGPYTMEGHCTSERPPFLRRQARAPTCQPCPSLREVACACSALARHCARSLWGRGPARALPTRARRAALATLGPCTMEGHCTSERPPFLRRQARAPTCQPCPSLREVACACSALARHCARSLWGRGPARALPTRARRAALATLAPYAMEGHCTSERPPFLRRQARAPTCQPCPLTARGGLRV